MKVLDTAQEIRRHPRTMAELIEIIMMCGRVRDEVAMVLKRLEPITCEDDSHGREKSERYA